MEFYQIVLLVLSAVLKLAALYTLVVVLFAFRKPRGYADCAPKTKFAVLIAARNEEAVIGNLVKSLLEQDYPRELFDVFVAPNNCSDNTAEAALKAGARIIECRIPVSNKGEVLHDTLSQLMNGEYDYDAFCIFDADNVADKSFLKEMNKAFCAGANVAKGASEVGNRNESWVAGSYGVYFDLFNVFYNRPRMNAKLSAKLIGTAFAVSKNYLEKTGGWRTQTIAEDAEFAADCAANGERVWYVPEAVSYDEAPNSFAVSLKQRKRWCSGVLQVGKIKLPRLAKTFVKSGNLLALDLFVFIATPVNQFMSLVINGFSLIVSELTLWEIGLLCLSSCFAAYVVMSLFALLLETLILRRGVKSVKGALAFPIFTLSFVALLVYCVLHKTTRWDDIKHTGSVGLEYSQR
ncbi:MAG: glycosyltransferase family 2 protein [Eubacteriaceae bacterium]|nr:glycosyltransferase family 2 protein [Eubacteriaceae bacterium]